MNTFSGLIKTLRRYAGLIRFRYSLCVTVLVVTICAIIAYNNYEESYVEGTESYWVTKQYLRVVDYMTTFSDDYLSEAGLHIYIWKSSRPSNSVRNEFLYRIAPLCFKYSMLYSEYIPTVYSTSSLVSEESFIDFEFEDYNGSVNSVKALYLKELQEKYFDYKVLTLEWYNKHDTGDYFKDVDLELKTRLDRATNVYKATNNFVEVMRGECMTECDKINLLVKVIISSIGLLLLISIYNEIKRLEN